MRRVATAALLCVGLLAAVAAPARAAGGVEADASPAADAKHHIERGKTHFKLGEFDQAVAEWKEAYRLRPVPTLHFNIAQAYRLSGRYRDSRFHYEHYLRDLPRAPNRDEVLTQLAQLEELIFEEEAARAVAQSPAESAPQPVPEPVEAGVAEVVVATDASPSPIVLLTAPSLPQPAAEPFVELTPPSRSLVLPVSLGATAAALGIASGVTYALAHQDWSAVARSEHGRAEVDRMIGAGDLKHRVALGLAGAALLTATAAALTITF